MARVIDGRLATRRIVNNSITNPKMADSAVDTAELVDGAVQTTKIADSQVSTAKVIDGDITDAKLNSLFQSQNLVSIDSTVTSVSFPTTFSDTPVVITAPGPGVTYARVTTVTPTSFGWVADASGSASWQAHGHR